MNFSRQLPAASDRDRIDAARYAAMRLSERLNAIAYRRKLCWSHYSDSSGGVVSVVALAALQAYDPGDPGQRRGR